MVPGVYMQVGVVKAPTVNMGVCLHLCLTPVLLIGCELPHSPLALVTAGWEREGMVTISLPGVCACPAQEAEEGSEYE